MEGIIKDNIQPEDLPYFIEEAKKGNAILLDISDQKALLELSAEELLKEDFPKGTGDDALLFEEEKKWLIEKNLLQDIAEEQPETAEGPSDPPEKQSGQKETQETGATEPDENSAGGSLLQNRISQAKLSADKRRLFLQIMMSNRFTDAQLLYFLRDDVTAEDIQAYIETRK